MTILFSAQDPGGVRALAPVVRWISDHTGARVQVFAYGYAPKIFETELVEFKSVSGPPQMLPEMTATILRELRPRLVVTGTAARRAADLDAPMFDQEMWYQARRFNIPTLAVLDSWQNHIDRFSDSKHREPFSRVPDYIAVMDDLARSDLISAGLRADNIFVTGQPYLDRYWNISLSDGYQKSSELNVLFVAEPDDTIGVCGFNDRYTFRSSIVSTRSTVVLEHLAYGLAQKCQEMCKTAVLSVKPHPKSPPTEFESFLGQRERVSIQLANHSEPFDSLRSADIVVGMISMMLIEAYLLKLPVVSVVPHPDQESFLVLNRMGLVRPAHNPAELLSRVSEAIEGKFTVSQESLQKLTDGRAAERVGQRIADLLTQKPETQ